MSALSRSLLLVCAISLLGCSKPTADFTREVTSPSGRMLVRIAEYQPRGTIEGHLSITFVPRTGSAEPQITVGHVLKMQSGWVDDHTFALVYDVFEPSYFSSPVYATGEVDSEIEIITCNRRYLDCAPILSRLSPARSLALPQFPEGTWPTEQGFR